MYLNRYARAYAGIQFFDHDSLLPPPFTFLSILVLIFQLASDSSRGSGRKAKRKKELNSASGSAAAAAAEGTNVAISNGVDSVDGMLPNEEDQTYPTLIFSLLESAKAISAKEAEAAEWRKKQARKASLVHPAESC